MIERDQVLLWLVGISKGIIVLDRDNEGMARAAIALLEERERTSKLPPGYLSPNFTLAEFTASDTATANGIDNSPTPEVVDQLTVLAHMMERVRVILGQDPIFISSGYRCPELNAAVGGASNSAHLYGCACDFTCPDFGNPTEVCAALSPHLEALGVDQLIDETGGGARWVHIGRASPGCEPRYECFAL